MKRKIYNTLLAWKANDASRTALLIDGARRVGKSYVAEEFGSKEYKSYLLVDFNRAGAEVRELFERHLDDLDTFFTFLSTYYNVPLFIGETLIIFDEVQLFPRARSAIKYLVADGRYHYLETGSLVTLKSNLGDALIPSEERHIRMFPMDFEEFLWALGNETLMPLVKQCFAKQRELGQVMHRKAMDAFRQYLVVGGMPQAVAEYAMHRDFNRVDAIKRDILQLYRNDIVKHARGYERKVTSIFDEIPAQLQKHEKRFNLASLSKAGRYRDYEDALFWLTDAMIVNPCYNSTEPGIGLKMNMQRTTLKCYMADTGLLISHAFDENSLVSEEIYKKLLFGKLEVNEGMMMENIVAQMLTTSGHNLYFYSSCDREDASSRMEIDFLIAKNKATSRHNISPIEVKSGTNYTFSSLNKFRTKYPTRLRTSYVLHTADYAQKDGITFLPLYMTPLL